jgi:rare lipoprotein A
VRLPMSARRPLLAGALCTATTGAAAAAAFAQTPAPAAPGAQTAKPVAAKKARITVQARRLHVIAGRRTSLRGHVRPGLAGLPVALQARQAGHWVTLDRDRTRANGRYRLRDRVHSALSARVRVRVRSGLGVRGGTRGVGRLNVYRYANASWYGPGLYGGHLGCGGTLGSGTLGVAHKALPCGSMVSLRHGGRTVRVPVVDRGPYVAGREFDLTAATAARIGFHGHGAILVAG